MVRTMRMASRREVRSMYSVPPAVWGANQGQPCV